MTRVSRRAKIHIIRVEDETDRVGGMPSGSDEAVNADVVKEVPVDKPRWEVPILEVAPMVTAQVGGNEETEGDSTS